MKGLKKLALATAIAAAPFAQAELTSIDDSVLSEMTGQAGISIELSTEVTIGAIEYTDTDGLDGVAADAGTIGINTIAFGGSTVVGGAAGNEAFDDIKIDIDVDATDGLIIHLGGTNPITALTGSNPVDFGLTVGEVQLNGTNLVSGISIGGNLGPVDVAISNAGVIAVDAYFEVTSGAMNVDVLGLGITNLTIGQDSSPISSGVYAPEVAGIQAQAVAGNAALITGAGAAAEADYLTANPAATPAELAAANAAGQAGATAQVEAGAIAGAGNMAYVGMTIQSVNTAYVDGTGTPHAIDNALNVAISSMSMDITADLSMGSEAGTALSLGSIRIDDLDLSGTSLTIYGH